MTAKKLVQICKDEIRLGNGMLGYDIARVLPEKGGRFKVKNGLLIILPIRIQQGKGYVHPVGAQAVLRKGRIIIEHWETLE